MFRVTICCILLVTSLMTRCTDPVLKPSFIITRTPDDIRPIKGKWVRPVVYNNQIDFSVLPVKKKKRKFIHMMLPSILMVKHNMLVERARVGNIIRKINDNAAVVGNDSMFLSSRLKQFKAKNPEDLYRRMATHSNSIVLAQAALESGWGSSRFFVEANNVFGIWSYNTSENRIVAAESRGDDAIYLRSYPDLTGAIKDYFMTLARARPYTSFREQRLKLSDPYQLTWYLESYSELGPKYVAMVNSIIRQNKLTQYDTLKLDPSYMKDNDKIIF